MSWPLGLRRAALVAFPLAIPLWLVLMTLSAAAAIAADAGRGIRYLWTEPPRRRGRSYYGNYRYD